MRTITVEVTQADIDAGERGHCARCPVALALKRATGCKWFVGATTARREGAAWWVELAGVVGEFIFCFDHGLGVVPFAFSIEVPE